MERSALSRWRQRAAIAALLVLATAASPNLRADFDADLEGIDADESSWGDGKLTEWKELEYITCRVALHGGPALGRTITILFDHTRNSIPGIENLTGWWPSENVVITSLPVLSAPTGSDVWSYTFTIDLLDDDDGSVEFYARLSAGAHRNGDHSLEMTGSPSLGTLPIEPPDAGSGSPDLALVKHGPFAAAPGEIISYTIQWTNESTPPADSIGVQVTDVLPPELEYLPESATGGAGLIGNTLVWDLGRLPSGATGEISYQAMVRPETPIDIAFRNEAHIRSSESDSDPSDNVSVVNTMVVPGAPIVRDDLYSTDEDSVLTVPAAGVLANDTEPNGRPVTVGRCQLVTAPAHGVLSLLADGSFTYTPAGDFNGLDLFRYFITDRRTPSVVATVLLWVNPVTDPPRATADFLTTDEDVTLSLPAPGVLANDLSVDGPALFAIRCSGPSHGTLTFQADGGLIYTPAVNYNGLDAFTYLATDGFSHSSPVTVSLNVRPINDAPSFTRGPDQRVMQNSDACTAVGWATAVRCGPSDESGQRLSFEITEISMPELFSQSPAVTPDGTLTFAPAANMFGVATITLRLRDDGSVQGGGQDASPEQTFTITVNSPPIVEIANPVNRSLFYAPAALVSLMANAADPDGTVTNLEVFADGQLQARSSLSRVIHPLTDLQGGNYTFTAVAVDDFGAASTSAPVTITIAAELPVEIIQALRLDLQTGLFKETVRIRNLSTGTWPGARLLVRNLASNVKLWNASGYSDGIPFVLNSQPLPPDSIVVFTLEYYVPTRQMPSNRVLEVERVGEALTPVNPDGTPLAVTRQVRLPNGDFMIEWVSLPGRSYYVQYTTDLREWKTAVPAVTGTGTRQQWIDNGVPKTESHPMSGSMRCYRVLLIP